MGVGGAMQWVMQLLTVLASHIRALVCAGTSIQLSADALREAVGVNGSSTLVHVTQIGS